MKRLLCILLAVLLLSGCAVHSVEQEWATGKITDMHVVRKTERHGKVHRWVTKFYITVVPDNYDVEYEMEVSESAYIDYLTSDSDDWMGSLNKHYNAGYFTEATLSDVSTAEEITVMHGNEVGTHNPEMDGEMNGYVEVVLPVLYARSNVQLNVADSGEININDGDVWKYLAYIRLNGDDGLYRVEVSKEFYENFYFSKTKAIRVVLEKYYQNGELTGTNVSNMRYID